MCALTPLFDILRAVRQLMTRARGCMAKKLCDCQSIRESPNMGTPQGAAAAFGLHALVASRLAAALQLPCFELSSEPAPDLAHRRSRRCTAVEEAAPLNSTASGGLSWPLLPAGPPPPACSQELQFVITGVGPRYLTDSIGSNYRYCFAVVLK